MSNVENFGVVALSEDEISAVAGGRAAEPTYDDFYYSVDCYADPTGPDFHNPAIVLIEPVVHSS
jgi:hypothetical protein